MSGTPGDRRFFASTRGQLLQHLRRGACTVDDLARALDLTDNAIRAHLATLERDGLVSDAGWRRTPGSRKPSQEYHLTPAADRLFPKTYDRVLHHLLGVLSERLARKDLEAAVREVGRRLAGEVGSLPAGDVQSRLEIAAAAVNDLGGLVEVVEEDGCYSIRGLDCAFAVMTPDRAATCLLAETFIGIVSGLEVCHHCDWTTDTPRCRIDVAAP